MEGSFSNPGYFSLDIIEEGRREIFKWSEKRRSKRTGLHGTFYKITKLFITRSLARSFMYNLSIVVLFQMFLGAICTYACVKLGLMMDVHMSLFVSPIVFPLAFSINANYQRRESVLEDLAMFKSSSSILFFCHRDWIKAAGLPVDLLKTLSNKLKFLVINIREYLLTEDSQKRKFILQAIYEDCSDIAQLNDKIRTSPMKSNSALVARIIHCHNLMCWAFERLRAIREYNSPRSLRAFTKVFIFLMPLLLSPYYVFSGRQTESKWTPYYISIMVSFLFGSLQSVQDKLDDPFDGIGEDDVKLGQLDDWTTQSLLTNRTVTIGRFTVTTTTEKQSKTPVQQHSSNEEGSPKRTRHLSLVDMGSPKKLRRFAFNSEGSPNRLRRKFSRKSERNAEGRRSSVAELDESEFTDQLEARCHGIASKLEGLSGTSIILPGNRIPYVFQDYQGMKSPEAPTNTSQPSGNRLTVSGDNADRNTSSFRLNNRLAVVRESDEDLSDLSSSPEVSPVVYDRQLLSMKSDAVVRPDESNQKRPTVLGMFSTLGNTSAKVSENIFTASEAVSSPPTDDVFSLKTEERSSSKGTQISSPNTDQLLPSTNSSVPLLSVKSSAAAAVKPESGSSINTSKTLPNTANTKHGDELTPTTSQDPTTEGGTSVPGGIPRLRFCLPGKHRSKGDGAALWSRRRKKKRPPSGKGKCESDIELTGANSMSPLLPHETNELSGNKENSEDNSSVPTHVHSKDSNGNADNGSTENECAIDEYPFDRPTDFGFTGEKPGGRDAVPSTETGSFGAKSISTPVEETNPKIVVNSPVEEKESSLWDFDLSSDKPSDSIAEKDGSVGKQEEKDVTFSNEELTTAENVVNSPPSIWDIPSSESNISPEPVGSRFTVSRNSNDLGNTGDSKPSSSRFSVSPS